MTGRPWRAERQGRRTTCSAFLTDGVGSVRRCVVVGQLKLPRLYTSDTPWHIREQQQELRQHLESYPEHYPKVTPEQLVKL